jgi:hypothetical protein
LNDRPDSRVLHISINFDYSENIDNEQMQALGRLYMQGIGFDRQPYLGYRHYDAGHPHFHLLTTNIDANGKRINIDRAFFYTSHRVTKELEIKYHLRKNVRDTEKERAMYAVQHAQKVVYGESRLHNAVSDVLNTVINSYNYTSLTELNAVLRLYNVIANTGNENSQLFKHRGLLYHVFDENTKKISAGIKASNFLLRPTLAHLQKRFLVNATLRKEHQERLTTAIDWVLAVSSPDWSAFKEELSKDRISVVVNEDQKGGAGFVFFIDHRFKAVFAGESLGDEYGLSAIRQKCVAEKIEQEEELLTHRQRLSL